MNVWTYSGRVGADPELRTTGSGEQVLSFRVANDVGFGNSKSTQWVDNSYWGKRAAAVAPYIKKGMKITVSGEVKLETYETRDGKPGAKLAVRVNDLDLPARTDGEGSDRDTGSSGGSQRSSGGSSGGGNKPPQNQKYQDLDDDIPF